MGYQPVVGRLFREDDQLEGNRSVAVLDYDFWQARFGADREIVGNTISLNGEPFEVIGVMQAGQKPPEMSGERSSDIWLPLHFDPRANDRRDWRGFYAVGRLAPGSSLEVARQELGVIRQGLLEEYPEDKTEKGLERHVAPAIRRHMLDFLAAVESRGRPVADIEEGYISTTSCILANMALELGRTLTWDPVAGQVVADEEANRLLRRPYRAPWKHPEPESV